MPEQHKPDAWYMRAVFGGIGTSALVLGIIGIFLPLLPTTPFILLSAACFAKASPRVEAWLVSHKRFGPMIVDWRTRGAISKRGKWAATIGMAIGFAVFLVVSSPPYWLILLVSASLLCVAVFILTRPH